MWKNLEHSVSENEVTDKIDDPGEGTSANRLLPRSRSYRGSFTGVELNSAYHENSEAEPEAAIGLRDKKLNSRERSSSSEYQQSRNDDDPNQNAREYVDPLPVPDFVSQRFQLGAYGDTYKLEKYKKKAMIIFFHDSFRGGDNNLRRGTLKDVQALEVTFRKFGFEIAVYANADINGLFRTLKEFCSKNFNEYGCVCTAILTHGSEPGVLHAYDGRYDERDIMQCFHEPNNPTLFGKPVIILIKADRGRKLPFAVNPENYKRADFEFDNTEHYNLPLQSDMLIFHSCSSEYSSIRTPEGSWFIQTLCEQICALAAVADFETICREVKRKIALEMEYELPVNKTLMTLKQMPIMTSSLLKLLYLRDYEGNDTEDVISPVDMRLVGILKSRETPKKILGLVKQIKKQCSPNINASTYELEKFSKNSMIIFNHESFLDDYTRKGTALDEAALRDTFERFRFDVTTHDDLDKTRLLCELQKFSKQDFNSCGCICVAILTHGSDHGYLRAFDMWYSERKVFACFDGLVNPTLVAKPIIFLIQADRGRKLPFAVNPENYKRADFEFDNTEHYNLPLQSDMLIFHSCSSEYSSIRTPEGSWFIQTLCEQICALAAVADFETICREVKRKIALEMEYELPVNKTLMTLKQMPIMTSSLLKLLYLRDYEGNDTEDVISPVDMRLVGILKSRETPKKILGLVKQIKKQCSPNINASTYELEKFSKNSMIIFNHESFLDDYTRKGTALDEAALRDTFERFRFDVTTHDDLDKTRLLCELQKFSKQDFNSCGCICVAILTHGSDHGYLRAFDMWYSERKVFACFDGLVNPTLVAKPIIFLIQACRGPKLALSVPVPQPYLRAKIELDYSVKRDSRCSLPSESDMIILHSCFFGRASARVPDKGSWFIQTLCEQIKLHAATEHLEKITRRVRNIIALEKEFNHTKQVPVVTSTLLRKLFFKTNEYSEADD